MGFNLFKWIGKKVSSGATNLARLGKKNLGKVVNLGTKVSSVLGKGLNIVDKIPIVGSVLAPVTRPLTKILGAVDQATALAQQGQAGIEKAENLVGALKQGDLSAVGGLKDLAKGGVQGMRDAKRVSVGFGTGVRDSVMGAKAVGSNVRGSVKSARRALGGS